MRVLTLCHIFWHLLPVVPLVFHECVIMWQMSHVMLPDVSVLIVMSLTQTCLYQATNAHLKPFLGRDLKSESEEPVASFMVGDQVTGVEAMELQNNTVTLAVTTLKGALVLFSQHLNG